MTPKQKKQHIQQLEALIQAVGFKLDAYGNYKRLLGDQTYRIKIKKINMRIERKLGKVWYKAMSEPLVKITIIDMAKFLKRFVD